MNEPKRLRVAVNRLVVDRKANEGEFDPRVGRRLNVADLLGENYHNEELTLADLLFAVKEGRAFCSRLKEEAQGRRKQEFFDVADLVAVDIDEGMTLAQALSHDFIAKYAAAVYTSASHRKEKRSGSRTLSPCDRFRIIFVLEEPITDAKFLYSLTRALAKFLGADPASTDPTRLFYGNTNAEITTIGGTLTKDAILAVIENATAKDQVADTRRNTQTVFLPTNYRQFGKEDVLEMLNRIEPTGQFGPENFERWRNLVFAVVDYLSEEEAREVLTKWTTFDEREKELETFLARKGMTKDAGRKITIGTLVREAYEAGWRPKSPTSKEVTQYLETLPDSAKLRIAEAEPSDRGLASIFVDYYRDSIVYTDPLDRDASAWYSFTGAKWERGPFSPRIAGGLIFDAKNAISDNELIKGKKGFRSEGPMIDSILKVARGPLRFDAGKFDRRNLLVFANCAIDLDGDSPVTLPHGRELLNTKVIPYDYDPNETNELWEKFVADIFVEGDRKTNPDLVLEVQKYLGYALTNGVEVQTFLMLKGAGSNGKSTFLKIITAVLDEYATAFPGDWLSQETKYPEERFFARLRGRRVAISNEMSPNSTFDNARIKRLISGDEPLTSEVKYENAVDFLPTHKLIIAVNHLPRVVGDDSALFRRVIVIPMMNSFTHDLGNVDPLLTKKILTRPSGVVNWLLDGLRMYREDPVFHWEDITDVREENQEYRDMSDDIGRFVEEDCDLDPVGSIRSSELYGVYSNWCRRNGQRPLSQKNFSARMKERGGGITWRKDAKGSRFLGISIKSDCEDRGGSRESAF